MITDHLTIAGIIAERAARDGLAIAITGHNGVEVTYAKLHEVTSNIAASLQSGDFGKPGRRARFGIVMPNGPDIAVALLGAAIAGEAVPFNSVSTAAELATYFAATAIDALIVLSDSDGAALAVAERQGIPLLRLTKDYRIAGVEAAKAALRLPEGTDVALVLMTSGSTGRPKIVPLTHRNVCRSAYEVAVSIALTPQDTCLLMWEQFHIGGLVDLLLAPLVSGGRIIATPGFNAARFFQHLQEHRPSWYQAVPTTLNELVLHAKRNGLATRPNSLRLIRSVAAALSPALMERVIEMFGVPVIRTFGMTEAGPLITSTPLPPLPQKPGSVGKSCGTQICIFGADGPISEAGQRGEVGVRGENVFSGYEGDSEANAASFRDGWFLTGDVGFVDADGDLFLFGRIKQMINRGGEKISPQEVDDVLLAHPAITEAATFALRHRTLGEDIAAAVVLREAVDLNDLRAFVRLRLAPFKVPQRITPLDALPRNAVGKIDRLALAKMAEVESEAGLGAGFAGPRNETDAFLVQLWARELYLAEVGIHQDFASLGGDSLSWTRILLAMEEAFGSTIPVEVFANLTTIMEVSDKLAALGFAQHDRGDVGDAAATKAQAAKALESVQLGIVGSGVNPAGLVAGLEGCGSVERFRIFADGVTVYATASEILEALSHMRAARAAARANPPASLRARLRLKWHYRRWRGSLQREIDAAPRSLAWSRRPLKKDAILYSSALAPAEDKMLIVGFTGNLGRLMQPTYRILACLDPARMDLLLLRDPAAKLFEFGVPGIGPDLPSVAAFAEGFAAAGSYRPTVVLGTSGGCLAALYAALTYGWRRAILVSTPNPARHPVLNSLLQVAIAEGRMPQGEAIVACGRNQRDVDAARQLRDIFPGAKMDEHRRFTSHNILNDAHLDGSLPTLVAGWLRLGNDDVGRLPQGDAVWARDVV
jgi:acyl-CoA synthetase (AMP-forming)/AMP-acid ligase II/acyl carrier protein